MGGAIHRFQRLSLMAVAVETTTFRIPSAVSLTVRGTMEVEVDEDDDGVAVVVVVLVVAVSTGASSAATVLGDSSSSDHRLKEVVVVLVVVRRGLVEGAFTAVPFRCFCNKSRCTFCSSIDERCVRVNFFGALVAALCTLLEGRKCCGTNVAPVRSTTNKSSETASSACRSWSSSNATFDRLNARNFAP